MQVIYIGSLFLNKVFHSFLKSTRFHFHFKFFNLRIWTLKCNNFHLKGAKGTQNLRYHYSLSDSECKIIFDNKYLSKIWGKFFFGVDSYLLLTCYYIRWLEHAKGKMKLHLANYLARQVKVFVETKLWLLKKCQRQQ